MLGRPAPTPNWGYTPDTKRPEKPAEIEVAEADAPFEAPEGAPVDAVVRNAAVVDDLETETTPAAVKRTDRYHQMFELPADHRVVLYIGQVMRGRGLRQIIADLRAPLVQPAQDEHGVVAQLPRRLGLAADDLLEDGNRLVGAGQTWP